MFVCRVIDGLPKGWRERVVTWAAGKDRVRELHLFGSRAKGSFNERSDVDLAYLLTGNEHGEKLAYSIFECDDWQNELEELLGKNVDLQFTDIDDDLVVWRWVREHGQLLYRNSQCLPAHEARKKE